MSAATPEPLSIKPPVYKQAMVGVMVGAMLGPLVGWFIGTFATFYTTALLDNSIRGMRTSAFVGGLFGILFGFITGVLVATPVRMVTVRFPDSEVKRWFAVATGCLLGSGSAYLIHQFWNPSAISFWYLMVHSVVVGGVTATVAALAKPKWL